MGEVHVVEHRAMRELRVMKIVKGAAGQTDAELAKRLMAEGRALRGLRHPNVVEVLDMGTTDSGSPFIVTELLEGNTLRDEVINRGPIPWRDAVRMALDVLKGLEALHNRGVVHRDIKPLNLFLLRPDDTGYRTVKILDLGIAKAVSREAQERAGSALVATRTGFFAGSPAFVSPEQVIGHPLDGRTDLYSLGAVLMYLLTERPPFSGKSAPELLTSHMLDRPKPPSASVPGVPPDLDRIVLKALEKEPSERFVSARSMRTELEQLVADTALMGDATAPIPAVRAAPPVEAAIVDSAPTEPQMPVMPEPPSGADEGTLHVDLAEERARARAAGSTAPLPSSPIDASPAPAAEVKRAARGTVVMGDRPQPAMQQPQEAHPTTERAATTALKRSFLPWVLLALVLAVLALLALRYARASQALTLPGLDGERYAAPLAEHAMISRLDR